MRPRHLPLHFSTSHHVSVDGYAINNMHHAVAKMRRALQVDAFTAITRHIGDGLLWYEDAIDASAPSEYAARWWQLTKSRQISRTGGTAS